MVETLVRTAAQMAEKLEGYFFRVYNCERTDFTGNDPFTLFSLLKKERQQQLIGLLNLNTHELPVLVLKLEGEALLINTTERFIKLENGLTESIPYKEFGGHRGFDLTLPQLKALGRSPKTSGYFMEFGIYKNGEIVYWRIPTGGPGFGFWNVTKRCEAFGRRFIISDYLSE